MAFSEGVRPGGLRDQQDIQVLICYLLYSIDQPLSEKLISDCILLNEIANHFEFAGALSLLIERGNVIEQDGGLALTENGREIARVLGGNLPLSIHERAMQTAVRLIAQTHAAKQTKVNIVPLDNGVRVDCAIDNTDEPMMSFSLVVADVHQAEHVKAQFLENPTLIYRTMVEVLMNPNMKKTEDYLYIPLK